MTDNGPDSASRATEWQRTGAVEKPPAMSGPGSVSALISQLKAGDEDSVRVLWDRYSAALIRSAQNSLRGQNPAKMDPEELAQSVFFALYRGAINEQFECLNDRAGFWTLVLVITRRKAIDRIRRETRQKRGGGKKMAREPTHTRKRLLQVSKMFLPVWLLRKIEVECNDLFEHLIHLLNQEDSSGTLGQVAGSRIAGQSVREIAAELDRTERTVERKLERIRSVWAADCEADDNVRSVHDVEPSEHRTSPETDQ